MGWEGIKMKVEKVASLDFMIQRKQNCSTLCITTIFFTKDSSD